MQTLVRILFRNGKGDSYRQVLGVVSGGIGEGVGGMDMQIKLMGIGSRNPYRTVDKPAMMYSAEPCATTKWQETRPEVNEVELRMVLGGCVE